MNLQNKRRIFKAIYTHLLFRPPHLVILATNALRTNKRTALGTGLGAAGAGVLLQDNACQVIPIVLSLPGLKYFLASPAFLLLQGIPFFYLIRSPTPCVFTKKARQLTLSFSYRFCFHSQISGTVFPSLKSNQPQKKTEDPFPSLLP